MQQHFCMKSFHLNPLNAVLSHILPPPHSNLKISNGQSAVGSDASLWILGTLGNMLGCEHKDFLSAAIQTEASSLPASRYVNVLQFSMAGLSISASFSISVWLHLFRLAGLSGQMKLASLGTSSGLPRSP